MKNLIFALLIILVVMNGCNHKKPISEKPLSLRYLALGDSYTIGEGVEPDSAFPAQLADALTSGGDITIETRIIAKTGWTTGQLINAISEAKPEGTFDLVTLLIGVNNQYRGLDKTQYRLEFRDLLQQAVGFAGGETKKVIVLSIPDYGVTPFAKNMNPEKIAADINAFNTINYEETGSSGAHYVEITEISRLAATDKTLLAGDSLHPSAAMYGKWVEKLLPVATSIVNQSKI